MAYNSSLPPLHEWLCKTNFSFLTGSSHPEHLLKTAIGLGYQSLCINDFDGMYGIARSYNDLNFIKKSLDTNFKLNYGTEIHLESDHDRPILKQQTLVFNCFSRKGYHNLCRLLTQAHKNSKDRAFISPEALLKFDLSDTFAIVPMRGGLSFMAENLEFAENLKDHLHNNLYLAITKTFNNQADQKIKTSFHLSEKLNLKRIFSQDIFFSHSSEKAFHDLLTAIKQNKRVDQCLEYHMPNGERSFHRQETFIRTYSSFPHFKPTLEHMDELNQKAQFCLSELRYHYPREFIPEGETAQSFLEKKTWEGAKLRYGEHIPSRVVDIIISELRLIADLKFADYFLTVWDIVQWARSQNILCQGRGSAANSSVCFALGITSCDPSLFDLLFERFVSKERGDPPDIDVDFEHERREEVIQYIYKRYGRARAAMVANVITFKTKGSLRAVGKALGAPEELISSASKLSSTVVFRKESIDTIVDETSKRGRQQDLPPCFSWKLWKSFSQKIYGFPRHLGLHSGGFIISQNDIDQLVPQEPATMEGRTVIQWCKDDIEELGFFKIDCLSLGMLTALRKAFSYVHDCYGRELDLYNLPQEDSATYSMIQKADTVGVFQIESRAQMSMLPRLKPKTFYDLVIEIAIIRPGPIQGKVIHPYLKRRNGLEPVTYPDPSIKEVLSKTLGVILFQEQLMRIAIALGDFTPGEANELRKHIGSWNSKAFNRNLNPHINKLLSGLKRKKVSPEFVEQMIEQIKGFSQYGFPESHSISFAFIAYASCYLKCHYPAAFFTAVLNSQPMGFYTPHALLQAAKRDKVQVLPLSVNHSTWDHQLEPIGEPQNGQPPLYGIRLGMRLISGLSQKAVDHLVSVRKKQGLWTSLEDFIATTDIYRDDYSALAAANAFSCFNVNRFDALWKVEAVPYRELIDLEERNLQWKQKNSFERAQLDFKTTGTSLETHPVRVLRDYYWPYDFDSKKIRKAEELSTLPNTREVKSFGMTLVKQAPPSAKGMVFLTLEDETGFINLAFTPQVYRRFYQQVESSGFICISGRLQKASNYHSILVEKVYTPIRAKIKSFKERQNQEASSETINLRPRNYY